MGLKPIETPADHEAALKEIERLWNAQKATTDGNRLEIRITRVEAYEEAHFPIEIPSHQGCGRPG
jgi:HTH-type transcriptional regulator/antitoxin HigA